MNSLLQLISKIAAGKEKNLLNLVSRLSPFNFRRADYVQITIHPRYYPADICNVQ